jgi:hypothetical protein
MRRLLPVLPGRHAAVLPEGAVEGAFALKSAPRNQLGGADRRVPQQILRQLHPQRIDIGMQAAADLLGKYP